MDRRFIFARNISYNFLTESWFFLLAFITTPYIVNKLGSHAYGIFSLVGIILGYFTFLNLGLTPAIVKYIAEYYVKCDYQGIRRLTGSALSFYLFVGLLGALIIFLLTDIFVKKLLHIPPQLTDIACFVFYISAISFLINILHNLFSSIPQALQRFDILCKVRLFGGTISAGFTVILLYLGLYLKEIVLLHLVIGITCLIIYIIIAKKLLNQVTLRPTFELSTFFNLFRFGIPILVTQSMNRIIFYVDKFLIGLFLPISQITSYVIPFNISQKLLMLPAIITPVVFPAISEISALKQKEQFDELYLRTTKFMISTTLPLAILIFVFAKPLLFFWIGPEFANDSSIVLKLLALAFFITVLSNTPATAAQGLGAPGLAAKFSFLHSISNVALWIILIPQFGILGAALTLFLSHVLFVPWFVYCVHRDIVKIPILTLLKKSYLKPVSLGVILLIISYLTKPLINNLYLLILLMIVLSLIYYLLSYKIVLDEKEREILIEYIRRWE